MTPPVLPGEVWRGDADGPVCVTLDDDKARAWYWRDGWQRLAGSDAADAFAAWALSLRADAQRAAEQMRAACADAAARVDIGTGPNRAARAIQSRAITAAVRALPIPAPTSPPPVCSCPDRIAAGTPSVAHDGRWYMLVHVERAFAEAHDELTIQDRDGNDYAVNMAVTGCPWCARPLPDGKAENARREAESLHVPGCARVEAEGVGHPGACVEPTAANDRGKP